MFAFLQKFRWRHSAVVLAAAALPAIWLVCLVNQYSVDVPYADDFTLAPFLVKALRCDVGFADLFAQHNEHRYLLQRLLLMVFVRFAHGDLRAQMFFSVFVCALTAMNLWFLLRRTLGVPVVTRLLILLLINLLLFSPVQAENWTWGFQFPVFLNNWLLTTGLVVMASHLRSALKFVTCAVIAVLATFSFGSGVLLWLLTFPLILFDGSALRPKFYWLAAWIVLGCTTIGAYFINYTQPQEIAALGTTANPLAYILYVTAFLGGHLSGSSRTEVLLQPLVIGTALLMLFSAAAFFMFAKAHRAAISRGAPWLALGVYAILNALLAAFTRIGFGLTQALDSRYTSFSLYLSISLIGLAAVALAEIDRGTEALEFHARRLRPILLTAFFAFSITAYAWGLATMRESRATRLRGKGALLFANVIDSSAIYERCLAANNHDARAFANVLDGARLLRPRLAKTANVADLRHRSADDNGYIDAISCGGDSCYAKGWASIPLTAQPADCIFLAYIAQGDKPVLFRIAEDVQERPDVVRVLHNEALHRSGWASHFARSAMPAGAWELVALALDARQGILYQLPPRRLP